jgi:hypothetical protein
VEYWPRLQTKTVSKEKIGVLHELETAPVPYCKTNAVSRAVIDSISARQIVLLMPPLCFRLPCRGDDEMVEVVHEDMAKRIVVLTFGLTAKMVNSTHVGLSPK